MVNKSPLMTVLDFVKNKAKFHSNMKYLPDRKGFEVDPYGSVSSGVYFILYNDQILKVGKADGKYGLKGRVNSYRGKNASRVNDPTVKLIFETMTGEYLNKILQMYVYEVPPEETIIEGYKVPTQMARGLEKILSMQARIENHPMKLSGVD